MATIKKYKPGEFCWADLGIKDTAGSKKFYRGIFAWETKNLPMGDNGVYSMQQIKGKEVCALYPMMPEQKKRKPMWLPFINVTSVDRTIKKVKAAGGSVCAGPMDVPQAGRMAVLQDPTGAVFALWQARGNIGTKLREVPGSVCWHDLSTPDTAAAGKFYGKVFGWKVETMDFGGNSYNLFKQKGKGVGGMWPLPLPKYPPGWFTYWVVESCARTVAKAKRLGGKLVMGPITVPKTCTFALIKDPQGAAFGVLEPLG